MTNLEIVTKQAFEGWQRGRGRAKAHYFIQEQAASLCWAWEHMVTGELRTYLDVPDDDPGNCKTCQRKLLPRRRLR